MWPGLIQRWMRFANTCLTCQLLLLNLREGAILFSTSQLRESPFVMPEKIGVTQTAAPKNILLFKKMHIFNNLSWNCYGETSQCKLEKCYSKWYYRLPCLMVDWLQAFENVNLKSGCHIAFCCFKWDVAYRCLQTLHCGFFPAICECGWVKIKKERKLK